MNGLCSPGPGGFISYSFSTKHLKGKSTQDRISKYINTRMSAAQSCKCSLLVVELKINVMLIGPSL